MILQKDKIGTHLSELAVEYGNFLLQERVNKHGLMGFKTGSTDEHGFLHWNNPENLDTGTSGLLLFLLELYRHTREERYLTALDEAIADLVEYCRQTPTDNYSLYTGRCGVIYLLMQRYLLNEDEQLITTCLELIKPANHRFLHSKYTTEYLYDGRAGTLLVLLHLYFISKEAFLLKYIDEYINVIMQNAKHGTKGIYWMNDEEFNIRPSCGFAHGTAGITYVLKQVNAYASNPGIELLLSKANEYTATCWVDSFSNWGNFEKSILSPQSLEIYKSRFIANDSRLFEPRNDYSWAGGTAGMLLAEQNDEDAERIEKIHSRIFTSSAYSSITSTSLYDGLAGLGMFYLSTGKYASVKELASVLLGEDFSVSEKYEAKGGLMQGKTGLFYFLLKASAGELPDENVLAPFANFRTGDASLTLSLTTAHVRRTLLVNLYPRTLLLLEIGFPSLLKEYLQSPPQAGISDEGKNFSAFIENTMRRKVPYAKYERVSDVYLLEKGKLDFIANEKRNPLMIYLHDLHFQDKISELMNKPDEWLFQQRVSVSKTVGIIKSKWNWSLTEDFKMAGGEVIGKRFTQNFNDAPGQQMYFLQIFGRLDITEVSFTEITTLLWEQFKTPKTIRAAIDDIAAILQRMPAASWQKWMVPELNHKKLRSSADLIKELDWLMLKYLKPLLYRNVLVFHINSL